MTASLGDTAIIQYLVDVGADLGAYDLVTHKDFVIQARTLDRTGVVPPHSLKFAMEDLIGRQFGAYRIVSALGQGGMAAVYRAHQPAVDRDVAIKVLGRHFANAAPLLRRFHHEAKIVAQLQHPHILPIFDFGETDGYTYLAMPLLHGGTLAEKLTGTPMPLPFVERVITQICAALDYAHTKGIVHRDIKPTNILIDEVGNCLVADFGIAYLGGDLTRLTATGALMGTPTYMSPEQVSGAEVGPQSDLYSVGIMLYEMLTGRVPFRADTPIAVAFQHVNAPLEAPRTLNPSISPAVEAVVLKALSRTKTGRFPSGADLASALSRAIVGAPADATASTLSPGDVASSPVERLPNRKQSTGRRPDVLRILRGQSTATAIAVLALVISAVAIGVRWRTARGVDSGSLEPRPPTPVTAAPQLAAGPVASAAEGAPQAGDSSSPNNAEDRTIAPPPRPRPSASAAPAAGRAPETDTREAAVAGSGATRGSTGVDTAQALQLACDRGDGARCFTLGLAFQNATGVQRDVARATTLFQRSCDNGSAQGCNASGIAYLRGLGVQADDKRAAALFQRACDGSYAAGCVNLGRQYVRGVAVGKDEKHAADLFQRACDLGDGEGCTITGRVYEFARGVPKDEARAASFYQRGCASGSPAACTSFGSMYFRGVGMEKDEARAVGLFQRACNDGFGQGCTNLAIAFAQGRGVAKDENRATDLFQQGCDKGSFPACVNIGLRYARGGLVTRDEARAATLFQRACDGNFAPGCLNLGSAYADGRGVPRDENRSLALYQRACDSGMADACTRSATMYEQGRGATRDAARAAALYRRGRELLASAPADASSEGNTGASAENATDTGWMSSAQYSEAFTSRTKRGFHPTRVEGRVNDGRDEYRAEWKGPGRCQFASYHRITKQRFDEFDARYKSQGFTLIWTAQFVGVAGTTIYQATWTKNCAP